VDRGGEADPKKGSRGGNCGKVEVASIQRKSLRMGLCFRKRKGRGIPMVFSHNSPEREESRIFGGMALQKRGCIPSGLGVCGGGLWAVVK